MALSRFTSAQKAQYTSQQQAGVTLILRTTPLGAGSGANVATFTFPVNPSDVAVRRPARQTTTQTLGGAYQDHWGEGLVHVSISGSTGWRPSGTRSLTGYEHIIALREILRSYETYVVQTGKPADVYLYLLLDLPEGWERFRISTEEKNFTRTKSAPLLYMFDCSFIVLEDLNDLTKVDVSPTFVITSYPLKPPPPVIPPSGGGGGNGGGGNGNGNGSGSGGGGRPVTYDGIHLDAGSDSGVSDATASAVTVSAVTCLTEDYFYITAETAASIYGANGGLGDLANFWYGPRGWTHPASLWAFIRDANPDVFPASATRTSPLPSPETRIGHLQDSPIRVRMPFLDPKPWNGDADTYAFQYKQSSIAREFRNTVLHNAAYGAATLTGGVADMANSLWNGITQEAVGGWNAITQNFARGQDRSSTLVNPLGQVPVPTGTAPPLNARGPS